MKYLIIIAIIVGMIGGALSLAYNYRKENLQLQDEMEGLKIHLYEECMFRVEPAL